MFSTYARWSSLSLLLSFNHHYHHRFFFLLFYYVLFRSSCVRSYVSSTTTTTAGFSSSLYVRQEENEGGERKRIGGRRWWTMLSSFSIGQPHYKFFLLTDTFDTRHKVPWPKSVNRCVYRSASRGGKRKSVFLVSIYLFFIFSWLPFLSIVWIENINR